MLGEILNKEAEARRMHSTGLEVFEIGDFRSAEQYFTKATELAPNNPNCWAMLAHTMFFSGRRTEAINAYLIESQLRPDYAAAFEDIAKILGSAGRFDEALEFAQKAAERKAFNDDVLFHLGRLALKAGKEGVRQKVEKTLLTRNPLLGYTDIFVSGFAPWAIEQARYYNR